MQKKIIWLFGLSGAGKSTIACAIGEQLKQHGIPCVLLDGDDLRATVNKDLGYSVEDRKENIRRAAEFAKLLSQQNMPCICAFITPFKSLRDLVRHTLQNNVILFYLDTPLEECIRRDVKGLYKRAIANELKEFTGITADFEFPENEEKVIPIQTRGKTPSECASEILYYLKNKLDKLKN